MEALIRNLLVSKASSEIEKFLNLHGTN